MSALAGLLAVLLNWQGAGLMSDSTSYFKFPRSLDPADLPVHHGILYALMLGGLRAIGFSLERAGQCVNVLCFAGLGFVLASQHRPHAGWIALFTVLSLPMLTTYSTALSEPVFLLLTAIVLTRLPRALADSDGAALWPLALVAGLAAVARYSGVALIGAGGLLVLFCWKRGSRWRAAFTWGLVSVLPLVAVMAWNHLRAGSATNRTIAWHFIPPESRRLWANTLATWIVPYKATALLPFLETALALGLLALPLVAVAMTGRRPGVARFDAVVPASYGLAYAAFIGLSICVADVSIMPDNRMLSPLALCVWPLLFSVRACIEWAHARLAASAMLAALGLMMVWRAASFTADAFRNGREYSAKAWRNSSAIRLMGELGPRTIVFSNASDADELLHGGHAEAVPWEFHPTSMLPRPDFTNRLERLRDLLVHSNAVVIRADVRYWPPYLVTEERLLAAVPGLLPVKLPDGTAFLMPGNPHRNLVERYAAKP